ncbi:MAG TPA: LON peptidase substrate-binding domain-containing protein [Rariglobus sp.]|jgi:ATP-dependent Lon protease|nr:LON peptidase substrate-binding domain-containing protein [Rariglobus sp.]
MEMEIVVPDEVPVMTLPNLTFFPQALLPLHIFEPRYRDMLRDVLATNRLFAVAGLNSKDTSGQFEPLYRIATIGIVRACQGNEDGTSNLLLQGLARVEVKDIVSEEPYRSIRIQALTSQPGAETDENLRLRTSLSRLISTKQRLGGTISGEFTRFLKTVEDPEIFSDLTAFNLCDDPRLKQKLLETLDVHKRLELLNRHLRVEVESLKLLKKLQGDLPDDRIVSN